MIECFNKYKKLKPEFQEAKAEVEGLQSQLESEKYNLEDLELQINQIEDEWKGFKPWEDLFSKE